MEENDGNGQHAACKKIKNSWLALKYNVRAKLVRIFYAKAVTVILILSLKIDIQNH